MMGKTTNTKKQRIQRRRLRSVLIAFVFLIGLVVLLYPFFSDWYYRIETGRLANEFTVERDQIPKEEIEERIKLAQAYNDALHNAIKEGDPYAKKKREEGLANYAKMLEIRQKIGVVEVPSVDIRLPIFAGTSESILENAAGHLEGTSLPIGGNSSHTVITAHSGLPKAKLFTDLHQVQLGDKFFITNIKETLAYQVDSIDTIDPSDFSRLLIVPGHDYATLLTCTPVGINSHRLIVRGHRIPYTPAADEPLLAENKINYWYQKLFFVALAIILILLLLNWKLRKDRKKIQRLISQRKQKKQNEKSQTQSDTTSDADNGPNNTGDVGSEGRNA